MTAAANIFFLFCVEFLSRLFYALSLFLAAFDSLERDKVECVKSADEKSTCTRNIIEKF